MTFGGIYSQFCVWNRSRYHVGCDIVVNMLVGAFCLMAFVGSRLVWTIQTFFCNYQVLFPENSNPITDDICESIKARYSQNYLSVLLRFNIGLSVVQTTLAVLMNCAKRWKPVEWRIAQKLEAQDFECYGGCRTPLLCSTSE
eukprot:Gregarina_sp_Poly_1__5228@NODE_2770_length_1739_cov_35_001196_g1749_i0_p2_GENE_NODE_2770_length_1739_cov_35_001196_g1749_i0NODE_2770_length_1739_cov_35_001196_g1749_i0_p2_ORF_typecomplete_len142_score9_14_NODE_2770_length_1739_cov_35_001196_g1749_i0165590